MTVLVSSCLFGVNEVKVKKKKIRYYIVLGRAQGPTLLDCNFADTCFTVALGSVLAGCDTQVPHRSTLYQQIMSLVLREDLKPICPLSSCSWYFQKGLENRRNLVEHLSYEMHPDLPVNRHTGWITRKNWMTSYSSTAVLCAKFAGTSAAREVRACSK